jgi:hypothetical protein
MGGQPHMAFWLRGGPWVATHRAPTDSRMTMNSNLLAGNEGISDEGDFTRESELFFILFMKK